MITTNFARTLPFSEKQWERDVKFANDLKNMRLKGLGLPDKLSWKPQNIEDLQEQPYFIALDTETYGKNGNLICLCNSDNLDTLYGTVDKSPRLLEYYHYLLTLKGERENVLFIVYNLKFDAQIILKSLGKKITSLYFGETANGEKYTGHFGDIKIKYIPKKMLELRSATDRKQRVLIYDAMQLFLGSGINKKSDLDSVATKYLGKHKEYDGKYQDKHFPDKIEESELTKIVAYCQQDCRLTKQIMDIWTKDFYSAFGFYPQRYHSLGTIAIDYLRTQLAQFPTFAKIPYAVHELAYASYFGGRFEITHRGTLKNIYHYDIRSAYPYAMAKMPDFSQGKWIKIKSVNDFKKYRDNVGFYDIITTVKERNIAPFMLRGTLGLVYCPVGKFQTHTTGAELDKALEYYDVSVSKLSGYAFVPNSKGEKWEFNDIVREMYNKRMNQTNEGQKYIYKVIINSLYGKTAQSRPEPRGIFNPVMCSYITGLTRSMLLDASKDNKEDITQFATDGIFSQKKLNLPESKKLGDYEAIFHPKMYVIMAGVYSYNSPDNLKMTTKSRGFELRTINKKGEKVTFDIEDYKLSYQDGKYYYEVVNRSAVPASKIAMRHKGYDWEDIGKMEFHKKEIDLNGDNKRIWSDSLKTVHDHNWSRPINADLII